MKLLDRSESFTRVELGQYLDHWTDILQELRHAQGAQYTFEQFDFMKVRRLREPRRSSKDASSPRQSSCKVIEKIQTATKSGSKVDFDVALSATATGDMGEKAIYWVHHEQLIELQVMLLQYLRPYPNKSGSQSSTMSSTPSRTRRSSILRTETPTECKNDTGVLLLDQLQNLSDTRNSKPTSDTEEHLSRTASASIRWTSSDDTATVIYNAANDDRALEHSFKVKCKYLAAFLDLEQDFSPRRNSAAELANEGGNQPNTASASGYEPGRKWLRQQKDVQPLVSISSKRIRLSNPPNAQDFRQWCILDVDISMKKVLPEDIVAKDWPIDASAATWSFPHAVLEVRQEGHVATDLIRLLDRSHLVSPSLEESNRTLLTGYRRNECAAFPLPLTLYGHAGSPALWRCHFG